MQQKIKYSDVMALGFTEEKGYDNQYFQEFGYPYCIVSKKLTKRIILYWTKETQLCEMTRLDDPENCNIMARMPIRDLAHLKEIVDFFTDKPLSKPNSYPEFA